jgi:hypothetical protein
MPSGTRWGGAVAGPYGHGWVSAGVGGVTMNAREWQAARMNDSENPLDPDPKAEGYQVYRRKYCETCLLRGVKETRNREVHHIIPRNIFESAGMPELEFDPRNLVTLCDIVGHEFQCHKSFGHLGNYQRENVYLFDGLKDAWELKHK